MVKATYQFEANFYQAQMIVDDCTLYVPRGGQYEAMQFDDDKAAAKAFNKIMMERFNPREGWRITAKKMGEAQAPLPHQMVGYKAPEAETKVDIGREASHLGPKGRLIVNADTIDDAALEAVLKEKQEQIEHIYFYAREDATKALKVLAKTGASHAKSLIIDAFDQTNTRQSTCKIGDLSRVLAGLPVLERLFAIGDLSFTKPLSHPTLTTVALLGNPLPARVLTQVATGDAPLLIRMQLGLSSEAEIDDEIMGDALPALVRAKSGVLTQLSLTGDFDFEEMLTALTPFASALPPVLSVLGGVLDEDDAVMAALALLKKAKLRAFGIRAAEFGDDALAALEDALPGNIIELDALFQPTEYGSEKFLQRAAATSEATSKGS
jgi:hypothetical protein